MQDFSWLDVSALLDIEEEFRKIVEGSVFVDQVRCDAICKGLRERVRMLEDATRALKTQVFVDDVQLDLGKDIAYGGQVKKEASDWD